MSAEIGGAGANGFTNRDITTYFQTVPKDALEKMIWAHGMGGCGRCQNTEGSPEGTWIWGGCFAELILAPGSPVTLA